MSYCESLGAGEILLTSMDCDGTQDGYDTELLRLANDLLSIPVIASEVLEQLIILMTRCRFLTLLY